MFPIRYNKNNIHDLLTGPLKEYWVEIHFMLFNSFFNELMYLSILISAQTT